MKREQNSRFHEHNGLKLGMRVGAIGPWCNTVWAADRIGRDRCRFLRPKPALFSLQADRRRHTGAISGLRKNHLKVKESRFRQDTG